MRQAPDVVCCEISWERRAVVRGVRGNEDWFDGGGIFLIFIKSVLNLPITLYLLIFNNYDLLSPHNSTNYRIMFTVKDY